MATSVGRYQYFTSGIWYYKFKMVFGIPRYFDHKGVGDVVTSEARALPLFVSSKVNQSSGENNRKPCY